jgi:hypothetical protein
VSIPLQTDTAAQAALANQFGDTVAMGQGTVAAFMDEVAALQAALVGASGTATQAKAMQVTEAGTALLGQLGTTAEKIGVSGSGYLNTDETGGGLINASAGQAF